MIIYTMTTKRPEDGNHTLQVLRVDDRNARLLIIDNDKAATVVDKGWTLAFGARFGPDVQDVAMWESEFSYYLDHRK